ncbi:FBX34 protein, partial [Amia calva]|nr:FBX34 protein [Amia calva]
ATMHVKPYPKFQKKELQLETSQDNLRGLHSSQPGVLRTDRCANTCTSRQPCSLGGVPSNGTTNRRPFGVISTNTFCNSPGPKINTEPPSCRGKKSKVSVVNSLTGSLLLLSSTSVSDDSLTLQEEEGEGPLDIWAVIKPGNTKEKIAIFAAHQCNNSNGSGSVSIGSSGSSSSSRTISMKIKGSWEVEGSVAKRRKRSAGPDKSKAPEQHPPSRTRDCGTKVAAVRCLPCSDRGEQSYTVVIEGENVEEGEEGGKTLSVVEMVAYLEQRANALHMDCTKPSLVRGSGCIVLSKEQQGGVVPEDHRSPEEMQGECVRVLDMVAKLESECLKRQCEREAGGLSRNNSLRRNVGRVLLAVGESSPLPSQEQADHEPSPQKDNLEECSAKRNTGRDTSPRGHCEVAPSETAIVVYRESNGCGVFIAEESSTLDSRVKSNEDSGDLARLGQQEAACAGVSPSLKEADLSISAGLQQETRTEDEPHAGYREEPLPGMLFFKQTSASPAKDQVSHSAQETAPKPEDDGTSAQPTDPTLDYTRAEDTPNTPVEEERYAGQERFPFPMRKLVSHDFLEARFKIQQLLEPQQYMAFLPHHIMVKIFCFLPTETLAALKCTCHYFKFIIESYNVRPADSRWVSDPRYKDDPCKQCKKRYGRGDVSLCRWHHKPYCQALPYGPGYWMCCHGSQKDSPGCNVGLHDNRWVPAFHSINMPIYKKVRDTEEDS